MGMTHLEDSTLVRGQEFQVMRMPSMPSRSVSAISEAIWGEIEMTPGTRETREMRERGEGSPIVRNGVKDGELEREIIRIFRPLCISFFFFFFFCIRTHNCKITQLCIAFY